MQLYVDFVLLAKPRHQIACGPQVIGGLVRTLAEDLVFPLSLCHFGVDAFVVDAGVETKIEMLLDNGASDRAHIFVANAAIVGALRSGVALFREAERTAILIEEVLLLKTEPKIRIIGGSGAHVGRVWRAVGEHDFTKDDEGVFASGIGIERNRLENAIGLVARSLHGGAAVKSPQRQIGQSGRLVEFLDVSFAAEFRDGLLTIEPDVFKFVLWHSSPSSSGIVYRSRRSCSSPMWVGALTA